MKENINAMEVIFLCFFLLVLYFFVGYL